MEAIFSVYPYVFSHLYLGFIEFIEFFSVYKDQLIAANECPNSDQRPPHCCLGLVTFLLILHKEKRKLSIKHEVFRILPTSSGSD